MRKSRALCAATILAGLVLAGCGGPSADESLDVAIDATLGQSMLVSATQVVGEVGVLQGKVPLTSKALGSALYQRSETLRPGTAVSAEQRKILLGMGTALDARVQGEDTYLRVDGTALASMSTEASAFVGQIRSEGAGAGLQPLVDLVSDKWVRISQADQERLVSYVEERSGFSEPDVKKVLSSVKAVEATSSEQGVEHYEATVPAKDLLAAWGSFGPSDVSGDALVHLWVRSGRVSTVIVPLQKILPGAGDTAVRFDLADRAPLEAVPAEAVPLELSGVLSTLQSTPGTPQEQEALTAAQTVLSTLQSLSQLESAPAADLLDGVRGDLSAQGIETSLVSGRVEVTKSGGTACVTLPSDGVEGSTSSGACPR